MKLCPKCETKMGCLLSNFFAVIYCKTCKVATLIYTAIVDGKTVVVKEPLAWTAGNLKLLE